MLLFVNAVTSAAVGFSRVTFFIGIEVAGVAAYAERVIPASKMNATNSCVIVAWRRIVLICFLGFRLFIIKVSCVCCKDNETIKKELFYNLVFRFFMPLERLLH